MGIDTFQELQGPFFLLCMFVEFKKEKKKKEREREKKKPYWVLPGGVKRHQGYRDTLGAKRNIVISICLS